MTEPAADCVPVPARYPAPEEATAREVFIAWEKLRMWFNAVLAVETTVIAALMRIAPDANLVRFVVFGAIGANLCFCAGPVAEGYASLLGFPRRAARITLFIVGHVVAGLFTFGSMVNLAMRDF